MRVLVTGASGLLGGGVARALADRGDDVTVFQRRSTGLGLAEVRGDLADADAVRAAVAGHDAVVHLGAKVDMTGAWSDFVRVNVDGTRNVLRACAAAGVSRLVHTSSPSVAHAGASLVGAGAGPADPTRARGSYARSKALAERLALDAAAPGGPPGAGASGLHVVVLRPHLVWGPGDTQLVDRIVARARAGRLPLIGTGAPLVDTTYVDNAVDAFVAALDRCPHVSGEAFVVTNGEPRPIGEILRAWARAAGAPDRTTPVPTALALAAGVVVDGVTALRERLGHDFTDPPLTRFLVEQLSTAHWFDQRRTRAALGWAPRVSFDEGLRRLAAAYRLP